MPSFFDDKCRIFEAHKTALCWLSTLCESQKVRKCFDLYSPIRLLRRSNSFFFHFIGCKDNHFSQISQTIRQKSNSCEVYSQPHEKLQITKSSKWATWRNPIFRKCFCINKSKNDLARGDSNSFEIFRALSSSRRSLKERASRMQSENLFSNFAEA